MDGQQRAGEVSGEVAKKLKSTSAAAVCTSCLRSNAAASFAVRRRDGTIDCDGVRLLDPALAVLGRLYSETAKQRVKERFDTKRRCG